ncbi:MAG: thymidine kinase [Candidatus Kariarchaeaceae archaeon]
MNQTFNRGCLESIIGTMFSGKSKALIERGYRASEFGGVSVYYFKPKLDTRDVEITSRNGEKAQAVLLERGMDIMEYTQNIPHPSMIIIDEAQFFDESLLYAVQLLRLKGHNIIVAGLDKDFRGQPFGIMPAIMALSDTQIRKIYPVCSIEGCVEDGSLPQRLRNGEPDSALSPTVVIEGSSDDIAYRPVCQLHHTVPDLAEYIENRLETVIPE